MTDEMASLVAYWIGEICKEQQVEEYRAHFLGGEPLENQFVLLRLMDKINEALPATTRGAKEGKFVLFTNGDLFTDYNLYRLRARRVKIMLNPTTDSLEEVERKMKMAKSHCGGVSLAVVADETNMHRLPELATRAVTYDAHLRVNRLYNGGTIPGYIDEFLKQMHKVFDILLSAEKPMWPNFIMESTYITWPAPKNPNACGRWFLVIDPDGTIRSCNADMDTKMGNVRTHEFKDLKFTHRWSAKGLPECSGCEWITWCQGGCPYTRKLAFGTYNKKTAFCEAFKELFPRLMELKERWIAYNGRSVSNTVSV